MSQQLLIALWLAAAAVAPSSGSAVGAATGAGCDRACLAKTADSVLASMAAHDASRLPLAADYAATENLAPSVPAMMGLWRTVTAVKERRLVIDPVTRQVFLEATVEEGGLASLVYGRLEVDEASRIIELELYVNRSRGQSGFMFDPEGPSKLPAAWATSVAAARLPSRAALTQAGRSMFDPTVSSPPAAPDCTVVETGVVAHLSAAMQAAVLRGSTTAPAPASGPASGSVAVSCESVPHRPADPDARTDIVDEAQGVVVGFGLVTGVSSSYLMAAPPESNFLPDGYYARYRTLQERQRATVSPTVPVMRAMRASASVAQVFRIYDGRVQGFQRFILVLPEGARSPWRKPAA